MKTISTEITKEIHLLGNLFTELFKKFSILENKKKLYKDLTGLTLIEINTIIAIGCERWKSMSEIANYLGVSFGTPTVTIDRLITKGYVTRHRDENDRRQVFVQLSEKGIHAYTQAVRLKNEAAERIFGILSPKEREVLIEALSKLNSNFDELF